MNVQPIPQLKYIAYKQEIAVGLLQNSRRSGPPASSHFLISLSSYSSWTVRRLLYFLNSVYYNFPKLPSFLSLLLYYRPASLERPLQITTALLSYVFWVSIYFSTIVFITNVITFRAHSCTDCYLSSFMNCHLYTFSELLLACFLTL